MAIQNTKDSKGPAHRSNATHSTDAYHVQHYGEGVADSMEYANSGYGNKVIQSMYGYAQATPKAIPSQKAAILPQQKRIGQVQLKQEETESIQELPVGGILQKRLSIGSPDDHYEKEADAIADQIMRMPEPSVQRKCAACEAEEKLLQRKKPDILSPLHQPVIAQRKCAACESEEGHLQRKLLASKITPLIQAKGSEGGVADEKISNQIQASQGGGNPMQNTTRSFMESRFGSDFSGVRVHTDSQAIQLSQQLNAQAFATGNDIYFNEGKYSPESSQGKHLLAHELTHVIQQSSPINKKIQKQQASSLDVLYNDALHKGDWEKVAEYLNGFNREGILERIKLLNTGYVASIYSGALSNKLVGSEAQVAYLTRWAYLDINFKNSLVKKDWKEAVVFLNGLNATDISQRIAKVSLNDKIELRHASIDKGFHEIVKQINADKEFTAFETSRVAKLQEDYQAAIDAKKWDEAATHLEVFNDQDIQTRVELLSSSKESLQQISDAAKRNHKNRVIKYAEAALKKASTPEEQLAKIAFNSADWSIRFIEGLKNSGIDSKFTSAYQALQKNTSSFSGSAAFYAGTNLGIPLGILESIFVDNIWGIIKLAWELTKLHAKYSFNPSELQNDLLQVLNVLPDILMKSLDGREIGLQVGIYIGDKINDDFTRQTAFGQGLFIGKMIGKIITEIALLFVGVGEVSSAAKALRATKWGIEIENALAKSRLVSELLGVGKAGKVLKGAEDIVLDAKKMEDALVKMGSLEEKGGVRVTDDMLKLESKLLEEKAKDAANIKPINEVIDGAVYNKEVSTGKHTYRQRSDGVWCRFSTKDCNVTVPDILNKPLSASSIILDANSIIALNKYLKGEPLQKGEQALVEALEKMGDLEIRNADKVIGEVKHGIIRIQGITVTVERTSQAYKDLIVILEKYNVGKLKGVADREIIADAFFALAEPGAIPKLATHDAGIYNNMFRMTGGAPEKLGKPMAEAFPTGFEVLINSTNKDLNGRKIIVVPLPKK